MLKSDEMSTYRHTHIQTDTHIHRHTKKNTDRNSHAYIQTDKQTGQTDSLTDKHTNLRLRWLKRQLIRCGCHAIDQ